MSMREVTEGSEYFSEVGYKSEEKRSQKLLTY